MMTTDNTITLTEAELDIIDRHLRRGYHNLDEWEISYNEDGDEELSEYQQVLLNALRFRYGPDANEGYVFPKDLNDYLIDKIRKLNEYIKQEG